MIFLAGSTSEGILLGLANNNPVRFNQTQSAPKDSKSGKTRKLHEWTLSNLIDASYELVI